MPGKHFDLDTDITLAGNDDKVIPSQKAVKTYVDTEVDKKADPTILRDSQSDTAVKELVINRLTNEEYEVVVKQDDQLYLTPDTTDQDITNAINEHNTSNSAHSTLFNAKQDKLTAQTAYTSKGTASKVPQITTNTLGQVTNITEVDITHQSIKTLKTDNTTGQTASASEAIAGSGTINLHKVSKTGSYNDLLNKPTIPTVNNNTITIQKNSTTVDSFTLNQSTDKSINISVPTTVAELSDSSDYVQTSSLEEAATVAKTGDYDDLINKPTKLSDFTDDLGSSPTHTHNQYLTSHQTIKTLKTDNTATQSTSASETLTGTGTINLHKIAKTGSYNDLLDKPTIPSDVSTNTINGAPLSNTTSYFYGTSSTAAATAEKEVSIPAITTLSAGQIIVVQPTVTSTVANSTIKLNSFTAYPMRYNNAAITTSTDSVVWNAKYPSIWVFDGTYWVFAGHGIDTDTTYSNMSVSEGTTGTATSQRTMRADYLKQIILGTVLTDLDISTIATIGATDTILSALGKLQAQINDRPEYAATFVDWSD